MWLLSGLNHIAIVTTDLRHFIEFYTEVFELKVVFTEATPAFRHAILRISGNSWLHPVEIPGNPHGAAALRMFHRGHLDHIALSAATKESFEKLRRRLIDTGASDGNVEDLGPFHSIWFEDPDGMRGELTLILDPELAGIHAPRPLGATARVDSVTPG